MRPKTHAAIDQSYSKYMYNNTIRESSFFFITKFQFSIASLANSDLLGSLTRAKRTGFHVSFYVIKTFLLDTPPIMVGLKEIFIFLFASQLFITL